MLHELLLSLTGHSDTFLEREFSKYEELELPFFHPSELVIINQILNIASQFRKIKLFYDNYGQYNLEACGINESSSTKLQKGNYLTALALGIYEETKGYRDEIVGLETELLCCARMPVSLILLRLQPFEYTFKRLSHVISVVEHKQLHGCKILELIHKSALTSVGQMSESLLRVEQCLHKVLYNQLSHWVLYGALVDPHSELFIRISPLESTDNPAENKICKSKSRVEVLHRLEMLPEHIPVDVAEKILFIGESILFFEQEDSKIIGDTDLEIRSGLVLRDKEEEFMQLLRELSLQKTFSLHAFSEVVESIRQCVAEHLCLLIINSGLIKELNDIKTVYLLGRGELYQAFFTIVGPLARGTISSVTNLNGLFHKAGHQVLFEESLLSKFRLSLQGKNEDEDSSCTAWDRLNIAYAVQWPLHKIFNAKVQEKYNVVLRFLLSIRRAQHRLQHLWIAQKQRKKNTSDEGQLTCWSLRHHMNLLIYNLQYYIQVDVLECHFWKLIQEIKDIKDYQKLVTRHHNFLVLLTTQCFLNHPILSSTIQLIIDKVHKFCDLLDESNENDEQQNKNVEIEKLREEFDRVSGKFFWVLSTLGQHKSSQHIAQLIMRIDYNQFYTRKSSDKRFFDHFQSVSDH